MAHLKKYLVPLTQPVLSLLADGINPLDVVKPVLMEVEQAPTPKDFIMQQDPVGAFGWIARWKDGPSKGKYFGWNTERNSTWTPYIGDARVFKRKATWMKWEMARLGHWEILPVYSDPRKTGLRALTGEPPRKYNFGPIPPDSPFYEESMSKAADHAYALLCESPTLKTLKASRRSLSPEEKQEAGDAPIWKATVDGITWYVSNTHRAFSASKSIAVAVREYRDVVEPSG